MKLSPKARTILSQITPQTKLGDLRTFAKDIKKDHELALELWASGKFLPQPIGNPDHGQ